MTKDASVKDTPPGDAPAKDAPAKDAPANDAPANDAPANDAPANDASNPISFRDAGVAHLSGFEQLRAMMEMKGRPGIGHTLDFDLVAVEDGMAAFEGTPDERAYNPIGSVHGGYAATLLDSACGCAVHSKLAADQAYTTLELKVAYHKGMTATTGRVRAEGRVVTIGRRAAFAEARLTGVADGKLYATATSTLLVMMR